MSLICGSVFYLLVAPAWQGWRLAPFYGRLEGMKCIVRTTNPVRLTYLQSLLSAENVPMMVFDQHISALEAGIGAFPRRLMVADGYEAVAKRMLGDVDELYDD